MKWPFTQGESSPPPHSRLPSSDQKPHFWQPKILYLPHTGLFKRARAARLRSLTRAGARCCLWEAGAVPGNVWVSSSNVTLLYIPHSSAPRQKKKKRKKAGGSDQQQTFGESRWLQQREKCLEFAIQGLWASSCVAFFLYLQLSVCSLGQDLGE